MLHIIFLAKLNSLLAVRQDNLACVAISAHACVNLADENQGFSSIPPPVKKSDSLICQDIVLTFVESALNHIGIIHIHNAVLNGILVFVKDIAYRLNTFLICADFGTAGIMAVLDNRATVG